MLNSGRETTPLLSAQEGVVAFSNVHSCGTETSVSVPCMFSDMVRSDYNASRARSQEGLLDVLKHAGLSVTWRDNQSGCKGTCDRVNVINLKQENNAELCNTGECYDEILLQDLQAYINQLDNDAVLVLHQMGSHGPEYAKRYPKNFEKFTPVCRSKALNDPEFIE